MAFRKIPPEEKAKRTVDCFLKTAKGDLDKAQTFALLARLGGRSNDEQRAMDKLIDAELMRRNGYSEKQIRGLVYGDWGRKGKAT